MLSHNAAFKTGNLPLFLGNLEFENLLRITDLHERFLRIIKRFHPSMRQTKLCNNLKSCLALLRYEESGLAKGRATKLLYLIV